jgi:hypothetical protein
MLKKLDAIRSICLKSEDRDTNVVIETMHETRLKTLF